MKFGVFLPNGSNGWVISEAVEPYVPTYEHQTAIVFEAEKQGLSFALPMIKFKGFGGSTGFWDHCMEPFTLVGALAAVTKTLEFIPTAALLVLHPAYTARMMATLCNMSQGRVGLNVVTGWSSAEYQQMDLWPGSEFYETRYEFASEYLSILSDLWTTGRCDRKSEYWKLDDCHCFPTPDYPIPIVSAGQSPAGIEFCDKFADQRLVIGQPKVLDELERRQKAGVSAKYGTYVLLHMIVEKTDEKARKVGEEIIRKADKVAISNMISSAELDTNKGGSSEGVQKSLDRPLEEGNSAFTAIPVIHGSPTTIAMKLDEMAEKTGADGFMFSWNDFETGIRTFGQEVLPRLNCV
jgi:pyrimidine oxygenase